MSCRIWCYFFRGMWFERRYNFRFGAFHSWKFVSGFFKKNCQCSLLYLVLSSRRFPLNEILCETEFRPNFYNFSADALREWISFIEHVRPMFVHFVLRVASFRVLEEEEDADVYERWNLKISGSEMARDGGGGGGGVFIDRLVGGRLIGRNADGLQTTLELFGRKKRIWKVVHRSTLLWNVCRRFPRDFSTPFGFFFLRENFRGKMRSPRLVDCRRCDEGEECFSLDDLWPGWWARDDAAARVSPAALIGYSAAPYQKRRMMQAAIIEEAGRRIKVRRRRIKLSEPRGGVTRLQLFTFFLRSWLWILWFRWIYFGILWWLYITMICVFRGRWWWARFGAFVYRPNLRRINYCAAPVLIESNGQRGTWRALARFRVSGPSATESAGLDCTCWMGGRAPGFLWHCNFG